MPRSAHRLPGRSLLALALAVPALGLIAPAQAAGTTTLLRVVFRGSTTVVGASSFRWVRVKK